MCVHVHICSHVSQNSEIVGRISTSQQSIGCSSKSTVYHRRQPVIHICSRLSNQTTLHSCQGGTSMLLSAEPPQPTNDAFLVQTKGSQIGFKPERVKGSHQTRRAADRKA
jgi:hypothetical protein